MVALFAQFEGEFVWLSNYESLEQAQESIAEGDHDVIVERHDGEVQPLRKGRGELVALMVLPVLFSWQPK